MGEGGIGDMTGHNPVEFARALSAKLAARSRHVCLLLGAGASSSCGLPDVGGLQSTVLASLGSSDQEALQRQLTGRNLEEALSRLRRISALLADDSQSVDGITGPQARALDRKVCEAVTRALSLDQAELTPVHDFAAWVAHGDYRQPVEVFTVNYDLAIETGLEDLGVPYFDGFVGTLNARFRTDLVEATPESNEPFVPAFFARLWKLHGSVNWARKDDGHVVRLGTPVEEGQAAAIYPSEAKYEESRRVPFVVLQDRLRRAIQLPETLLLVAGYSFRDSHLDELIFDAALRCQRSEFIAFCFEDIPDKLAEQCRTSPNLQAVAGSEAILGGVRDVWARPDDAPADLWNEDALTLCDFRRLAAHLARSATLDSSVAQSLSATRDTAEGDGSGLVCNA